MTQFEAAIARMHELAQAENLRAGLNAKPRLPRALQSPRNGGPGRPISLAAWDRRQQVAEKKRDGMRNKGIAKALGLSCRTVKADIHALRERGMI